MDRKIHFDWHELIQRNKRQNTEWWCTLYFLKRLLTQAWTFRPLFSEMVIRRVLWSSIEEKKITNKMWQVWAMILSPPPSYYLVLKIVSLIDVSFLKRKTFAWHRQKIFLLSFQFCSPMLTTICVVSWRAAIASELSIKVIFPKSGWQVWLNTLVYDDSESLSFKTINTHSQGKNGNLTDMKNVVYGSFKISNI